MQKRILRALLVFIVFALGAGLDAAAIDVGWMQTGVRAWYFGGVDTGGPASDAEEAYLLGPIAGSGVDVTHHSALTHWTSPKPTTTQAYSLADQGPWWIHPLVLQNIAFGDYWMGQQITWVDRRAYTWATFPHHTLPINALFDLQPEREIVKITYMLAGFQSLGTAYFDSETGIMLYYDTVWPTGLMFFTLAEINYNFAQRTVFAEDDGPHTGYHSWANEASQGNLVQGGGMVDFHSQVESRYGSDVEMWVITNLTGPTGSKPQAYENYAFFGGVPVVKRIAHDLASSVRPEQWNPFGQHLWWWLPWTATGAAAAATRDATEALPAINVFDVPMTKTADFPLTYTATESPTRFHFTSLTFGDDGYLRLFSAKDPTIGLDVKPTDFNFWNQTVTDGPAYFRRYMTDDNFPPGGAIPDGWVTKPGTDAGWHVVGDASYKGLQSLRSTAIGDNQSAGIQTSGNFLAGNVRFAARVSSEQGQDYFVFYVDGVAKIGGAGNIDWTLVTIPVEAGAHTFAWVYSKNGSVSSGSDAAWIDSVVLPPRAAIAPAATTNGPSVITATTATLNGTVSSNGGRTTVTFEYGETIIYRSTATATQSPLAADAANAPVSASVTGLEPGTLYHYRVVAANWVGTTFGSDMTFTTMSAPPPPALASAASRRTHGAAGTFDLALGLVQTNPTTEPRGGPSHTLVFTFDKPVVSATAIVTAGTGTAGVPTFSGNDVIVPLTGVANQQYVTTSLTNVTPADGGTDGSAMVRVGFLQGDVSQNRVVTVSDLAQVNAQIAQVVSAANFLKDVNASGTLTVGDKGIANSQITKALPAP